MDKIHATVHYEVYDVHKHCNMAEFGRHHIPGFRPELGYGFFEFKQEEFLMPHKAVILVDKVHTGYNYVIIAAKEYYYRDKIIVAY